MKNWNRFTAFIIAALLTLSLAGCGAEDFTAESAEALVSEVLEKVEFQQELTELPESLLGTAYDLIDGVEIEAYTAGYPADRFALFFSEDSGKLAEVKTMLEAKVQELIDTYSGYDTTQVGKLENAIIETRGNYVIFIVTDDYETAKELLKAS